MKRYLILILILPVFLTASEYNLDQLIEYGLAHSYQVQKDELSSQLSESSLRSAKWNLVPEAGVNAGISQDLDPVGSQSGTSSFAGFEIGKTISLNDASYFNYKNAKLDRQSADLKLNQAYRDYAYEVFQDYLETLSATKRRSALEENLAIQTRVWEQSKVLLQLGKTTPFEVKQNEIAVMNSRISIMQLDNTIENSRAKLFALVQMSDEGFALADLEVDLEKSIPGFSTEQMTELRLLQQELKKNELSLHQNKLDYLPKVNLSYNFSRRVSGEDFEFDEYNSSHGLNLNLSYSLWNLFTNKESALRTKINQQMLNLSYDDTVDNSQRNYDLLSKELEYLLRLDELYSERLAQSTEQIRIAEERYRLGMIQLLDLDKTRTDYISADIEYNTNRYQIIQKQEALNYLLSNPILSKW
ncbi:MAG TPA: TolC family protein [Candidatus Cloacimonadota bacterium]|nr:TolC family protein [Candidatus Cloacimonadota bacterium]